MYLKTDTFCSLKKYTLGVSQCLLSHIQQLDHHLFKQCKKDAKELCPGHDFDDRQSTAPQQGPLLFSCLHRLYRSEDPSDKKVRRLFKNRFYLNYLYEIVPPVYLISSWLCLNSYKHLVYPNCLQLFTIHPAKP